MLLKTRHFQYYNMVTLEIRFSLLPSDFCCWLLRFALICFVLSDFAHYFHEVFSFFCVVTKVSIAVSEQLPSDFTEMFFNTKT